jgi:hypothetical protein
MARQGLAGMARSGQAGQGWARQALVYRQGQNRSNHQRKHDEHSHNITIHAIGSSESMYC